MIWELHNAHEALEDPASALSTEWAALNARIFENHPLLSPAFITPLVRHFAEPDVLLARSRGIGSQQALLLLRPRAAGLWTTFLPSQAPISPVLVGPDIDVSTLLHALPGFALGIDFLCQDPLHSYLANGDHAETRERVRHLTTTAVELNSTFPNYWATRPKNLRRNMKRYLNRLAERGHQASLQVTTSLAEARSGLQRYGMLETAGWKGKAGTALHPGNEQGRFYADVLEQFSERDGFRIYELYFGEQLAASRLCVLNKNMLIILKTTYDETFSEFAPGRLLLYLLLEREFMAQEFARIEFYTNANSDSINWSTTTRDIYHVSHYRFGIMRSVIARTRPWRQTIRAKLSPPRAHAEDPAESDLPG